MKKKQESWKSYLANSNVKEKTYNVTLRRKRNGTFQVVGGGALMLNDMGGKAEFVRVDVRDLTEAIIHNGIFAR